MRRLVVGLLAVAGCSQQALQGDRPSSAELSFTTSVAATTSAREPQTVVYVRTRGEAQLYALIDRDGDRRVDEVRAVIAAGSGASAIVMDELPREAHQGWRYVRYADQRWLYLPFELERSSRLLALGEARAESGGRLAPRGSG